jgi:hypothetical protein
MWPRVTIFRDRAACNERATPQPQSAAAGQRSQRPWVRKFGASVGNQPSQRWMENVHTAAVTGSNPSIAHQVPPHVVLATR